MVQSRRLPDISRLNVYVVDPSKPVLSLFRAVFRNLGISNFELFNDSDLALGAIPRSVPGVVLVDWDIAPLNGVEFILELRKRQGRLYPSLPVIMMTPHADKWRVEKAISAGANGFLAKPISAASLRTQLIAAVQNDHRPADIGISDRRPQSRKILPIGVERRSAGSVIPNDDTEIIEIECE
jgi:two-component system chemotaxis response regulator CheY